MDRNIRAGRLRSSDKINIRLGRLQERWPGGWKYIQRAAFENRQLRWAWNKERLRNLRLIDGAYLLRTNLELQEPELLWQQYIQLTEVEEAFRVLKPIFDSLKIWAPGIQRFAKTGNGLGTTFPGSAVMPSASAWAAGRLQPP
jgi:hypothetical protein